MICTGYIKNKQGEGYAKLHFLILGSSIKRTELNPAISILSPAHPSLNKPAANITLIISFITSILQN